MIKILSGLTDGQVLQRLWPRGANVEIALECSEKEPLLATITNHKGKHLKTWKKRRVGTAHGGKLSVELKQIPEGGPYHLVIAAGKAKAAVERFYVGDVWILAGQSNMEGCGDKPGAKPYPLIRAFSMRREWREAEEPLHMCGESPDECHSYGNQCTPEQGEDYRRHQPKGVGPGLYFAHRMLDEPGVPQGLICTAHGGTSMTQWNPELKSLGGSSLYWSMLTSVRATGQRVAGLLWYQGESDTSEAAASLYTERMKNLVAATRRDLRQPNLPWVTVQIGRVFGTRGEPPLAWNSIQEQQRKLPEVIRNLEVVATIDLTLDDQIHIGGQGVPVLADRLAEAAARLVYHQGRGAGTPQPRKIKSVMEGGVRTITVTYDGVEGKLTATGEPHGFTLLNQEGRELPCIYKTTLEGNEAILHLSEWAPDGAQLCYGRGFAPVCNISDARGHALPVFGPLPIRPSGAWTQFVNAWNATAIIAEPIRALNKLTVADLSALQAEARAYEESGFVNEHPRWEGRSGHAAFSSTMELPEAMEFEAHMGYDGPFRFWVNDHPLFTDMAGINPCFPDESRKKFKLGQGAHTLRVAMDLNGGRAWGFFLRFKRHDVSKAQIASGEYARPLFRV